MTQDNEPLGGPAMGGGEGVLRGAREKFSMFTYGRAAGARAARPTGAPHAPTH